MGIRAQWYYHKQGVLGDSTEGPFTEADVAALIRSGKIKSDTLLTSPQGTNGNWYPLSQLDFSAWLAEYDAQAERDRVERENRKVAKAAEKARAAEAHAWADMVRVRSKEEQDRMEELERAERAKVEIERRRQEREQYLESIRGHQRRYRVIVASPNEAEIWCNKMGMEGWELSAAFAETFYYPQCCGPTEASRKFVLVFSQPTSVPS